tara:strand:+ start:1278 stop:1523 length:246 start_codon:yes stop_codon:yes gene_type:complete
MNNRGISTEQILIFISVNLPQYLREISVATKFILGVWERIYSKAAHIISFVRRKHPALLVARCFFVDVVTKSFAKDKIIYR